MPAVASSLTFSLWRGVRNSLLKRSNQHWDNARFRPVCSNIKKNYKLRPARLRLGEFQICMFQYPGPFSLCKMKALHRVFAVRIHKALSFGHRSTMIAHSMFLTSTKMLEDI